MSARPSVAGEPGRHTDTWRSLAWELGDAWADRCCAWADRCPEPQQAVDALLAAVTLRDPVHTPADAAASYFMQQVHLEQWRDVCREELAQIRAELAP